VYLLVCHVTDERTWLGVHDNNGVCISLCLADVHKYTIKKWHDYSNSSTSSSSRSNSSRRTKIVYTAKQHSVLKRMYL
jgi:hypothetical protein